jgi:multidrug resistance efflux pump
MVDTNDQVKQGQTLAMLDTSKLDQQTERSRAALLALQGPGQPGRGHAWSES